MAFVSDQKPPPIPGRCSNVVPKIRLDFSSINFHPISSSASKELRARRVPRSVADGHGGGLTPSENSDSKGESPGVSKTYPHEVNGEPHDFAPKRFGLAKRKAERELSSSQESEDMEGRPKSHHPELPVDLQRRKGIDAAKELYGNQDKENIIPGSDYRRREIKKQASDRISGERRRLQVSNKMPSGLLKHIAGFPKPRIPGDRCQPPLLLPNRNLGSSEMINGLLSNVPVHEIGLSDSGVSEPVEQRVSVEHLESDVSNTGDSMNISQPLLVGVPSHCRSNAQLTHQNHESNANCREMEMEVGLKPDGYLRMQDAQVSTVLVEQVKVVSASIKDLSSCMNSLAISDSRCLESFHVPSASGNAGSKEEIFHPNNCFQRSSILDSKQSAFIVQGAALEEAQCVLSMSGPVGDVNHKQSLTGASVASPILHSPDRHTGGMGRARSPQSSSLHIPPAMSVPATYNNTACTITVKSSAPMSSSPSTNKQFTNQNGQPLRMLSPSPPDGAPKSSQVDHVFLEPSKPQACPSEGGESQVQAAMEKGGMWKAGYDRNGSQMSEDVANLTASSKSKACPLKEEAMHSPVKAAMPAAGTLKTGYVGPSQGEIPMSEAGAAKSLTSSQVSNLTEKKGHNQGNPNLRQRKQGETDHYVWVNDRKYEKLKKIGSGGSSEVYKVIDRDCNIYALKRIRLKGRDYTTAHGFYQEIEYLNKLCGKSYIIRLIDHEVTDKRIFSPDVDHSDVIKDDVRIYMVLEYGQIDLAHMIADKWKERSEGNKELDEIWLQFYWKQILEAVKTIHEERIVHSDLKPANFLLVKGVLKLIDFGIAKSIQSDTTNIERESQVGTLNYMSPEAFRMNERDEDGRVVKCGRPSDIWSLGCILYQMVYGTTPFSHITTIWAKMQEVTNPNHRINYPPVSNPLLLDIMKKCLAWNRDARMRIPELLNHPFLKPHLARPVSDPYTKHRLLQLLQIQADQNQDREVSVLSAKLVERLRILEASEG